MARPPIEAAVTEKVRQYIERAEAAPPNHFRLSALAVATAIGHDRRVLRKYGLDTVIADAARRQSSRARQGNGEQRKDFEARISAVGAENGKLIAQTAALVAHLALVEANAKRLGIDPEELYKPLVPPDRRVSAVFRRKSRA
jgi:hypothetical protein